MKKNRPNTIFIFVKGGLVADVLDSNGKPQKDILIVDLDNFEQGQKYCPFCYEELETGISFCPECRVDFTKSPEEIIRDYLNNNK